MCLESYWSAEKRKNFHIWRRKESGMKLENISLSHMQSSWGFRFDPWTYAAWFGIIWKRIFPPPPFPRLVSDLKIRIVYALNEHKKVWEWSQICVFWIFMLVFVVHSKIITSKPNFEHVYWFWIFTTGTGFSWHEIWIQIPYPSLHTHVLPCYMLSTPISYSNVCALLVGILKMQKI